MKLLSDYSYLISSLNEIQDCTEQLLSGMDQHLKELDEECAQYRKLLDSLKEGGDTRLMDRNIVTAKLAAMKVMQICYFILAGLSG